MKIVNSTRTRVIDDETDKILAEWVNVNKRNYEERQEIARDIYAVMTKKEAN